jgi:methionine-rich copper-binding protein CopC
MGLALVAALSLAASRLAGAHAFPQAEEPKVGSTVTSPPDRVSIEFDARIESLFSKLDVFDNTGRNEDNGPPAVEGDGRELAVKLKPLKPGDYTVEWSVVAEDGHRTEGSYIFTVEGHP